MSRSSRSARSAQCFRLVQPSEPTPTLPTAALQSVQFISVRLRGARSQADRRRWFKAFQREMLQRGLASVRWRTWVCVSPLQPGRDRQDTHNAVDWLIDQLAVGHIELMSVTHLSAAAIEQIHQRLQAQIAQAQALAEGDTAPSLQGTVQDAIQSALLRQSLVVTRMARSALRAGERYASAAASPSASRAEAS